jgi:hypothetical protein
MTGTPVTAVGAQAALPNAGAQRATDAQWVSPGAQPANAPSGDDAQAFAQQLASNVTGTPASTATGLMPAAASGQNESFVNAFGYLDNLGQRFTKLAAMRHQVLQPSGDWGMDMARMMEYNWDLSMTANGCEFALSAAQAANNCSRSVLSPDKG